MIADESAIVMYPLMSGFLCALCERVVVVIRSNCNCLRGPSLVDHWTWPRSQGWMRLRCGECFVFYFLVCAVCGLGVMLVFVLGTIWVVVLLWQLI